MKKLLAVAVMCALGFTPAVAAEDSDSDDQKVICKREKETGSNLAARRVCMTRAQWDELREQTKREMRGIGNRALDPAPIPSGPRRSPTPGN